jgi:hypothetical protein
VRDWFTLGDVPRSPAGRRTHAAARQVWTPASWSVESLGGPSAPEPVTGHLCKLCARAVDEAGSQGPSALEMSLVAFLAPQATGLLHLGTMEMSGVVGWGGLVVDARHRAKAPPPPNRLRWGHVEDLDRLGGRLRELA